MIEQDCITAWHFPGGMPTTTFCFIATSTAVNRDFSLYLSNLGASWQNGGVQAARSSREPMHAGPHGRIRPFRR